MILNTHAAPRFHFIVIGNPITHSKSPDIHQNFAQQAGLNIQYSRQFCPDHTNCFNAVVAAFFNGGGVGANVTVPFKETAYQLCADTGEVSNHALVAGAVNTLLLKDDKLYGDNTDGQGLVNHFKQLGWSLVNKRIAILGAGGATRGIVLPLVEAGVTQVTIANRTLAKAENLAAHLNAVSADIATIGLTTSTIEALTGKFDLIINATSIGLTADSLPLDDNLQCDYAYDLMYGRELNFLNHFSKKDAKVSDGYGMLIGQAALSFRLWTGITVDTTHTNNSHS